MRAASSKVLTSRARCSAGRRYLSVDTVVVSGPRHASHAGGRGGSVGGSAGGQGRGRSWSGQGRRGVAGRRRRGRRDRRRGCALRWRGPGEWAPHEVGRIGGGGEEMGVDGCVCEGGRRGGA